MESDKIINWIFSIILGLLFFAMFGVVMYVVTLTHIPYSGFQFSFFNVVLTSTFIILTFLVILLSHKLIIYFSNNIGDLSDAAYLSKNGRPPGEPKSAFLGIFIPLAGFTTVCLSIILKLISLLVKDPELASDIKLYFGLFASIVFPLFLTFRIHKKTR